MPRHVQTKSTIAGRPPGGAPKGDGNTLEHRASWLRGIIAE